jgi:hypothetical protein
MKGSRVTHAFRRMCTALFKATCLMMILLTFALASAHAQVLYGTIIGTVSDSSGAALPGAGVEARNTAANTVKTTITDGSGNFRLNDLLQGIYVLTVHAKTFKNAVTEGVVVQANVEVRLDTQLQIATAGETITVTTAPPVLQADSASVATELPSQQLQELPAAMNAGMRNFQSAYTLVPGFSPPAADHSEAGNPGDTLASNVNGASMSNNNTRIDGVSDIYPWLPEIAAYAPSIEAIESVNIVTNNFDAEQGIAAGAAINVTTKSGSNRFHGTAWEYNTISGLEAKNYFLPTTTKNVPKYVLNEFGANYGGPILRNKAFFFGNWERSRRAQAYTAYETIPTPNMLLGDFSGTGTTIYDPTSNVNPALRTAFSGDTIPAADISYAAGQMITLLQSYSNAIPAANLSKLSNNYFAAAGGEYTRDNIDSRVDFNLSSKSTLFGRYGIQRTTLFDPEPLGEAGGGAIDGGQPGTAPSMIQAVGIGGTYAFTPTLLLDANFGFLRQGLAAKNVDIGTNYGLTFLDIPGTNGTSSLQGGFPVMQLTGLTSLGNASISNPFQFRDNTFTAAANLTWNRGKHSMRYGAEFQHYAINHFQPETAFGPRGGFQYTGGLTALQGGVSPNGYNSWADFLLGLPQTIGKDTAYLNPATVRESVWALYARDQWQLSPKITLTYGVRYEVYPFATRDHSGSDIFNPATGLVSIGGVSGIPEDAGVNTGRGNFVPRLGAAYRLNNKTVLRGGYGITVNPDNYRNLDTAYPAVVSQTYAGSNAYLAGGCTGYNNAAGTTSTYIAAYNNLFTTGQCAAGAGIPSFVPPVAIAGVMALPKAFSTWTVPANYRRGYIESYNLAVQREIGKGFTLQATYVGSLSIREVIGLNINPAAPGTGTAGRALYPFTSTIYSETPMGTADYSGLQSVLRTC